MVEVADRVVLSEHFIRITFRGEDLHLCGDTCLDQRVKLVLAGEPQLSQLQEQSADPSFEWYAWWLALDEADRPAMRTYTLRAVRPDRGEVDVDFACHGDHGPASRFALSARPGDRTVLVGPDAEVPESAEQGLAWRPEGATEVLLAGDETAVPAICGILESLPETVTGHAFLEVPTSADQLPLTTRSQVTVRWLARDQAPVGAPLSDAVLGWAASRAAGTAHPTAAVPDPEDAFLWEEGSGSDGLYVWLAGEAGAVTRLRRTLIGEVGLDKKAMSFMGYWKEGVAG